MRKLVSYITAASIAISISLTVFAFSASALSSNILAPFDMGSTWYVCQGYNNSRGTHAGSSSLSLDMTGGPNCDNSASGRNIRAPFSGKIAWYSPNSGSLCVNSTSNRSVMITHTDSSITSGTVVTANQIIGSVAPPNTRQNNGVAHAHLQAWSTPSCGYSNGANTPVTFDYANSMRMCGAPDMPANGPNPYNNGTWSGTRFTTTTCTNIAQRPTGYIYRFWSDRNQHHFYTTDYTEAQRVIDLWPETWSYEPAQTFQVANVTTNGTCSPGLNPVYRFWSDQKQGHFYTASEAEKNSVTKNWPTIWTYEKVAFCASTTASLSTPDPLYRFWSDRKQGHFYTADSTEKDRVIATWPDVWSYEGVAFYVHK